MKLSDKKILLTGGAGFLGSYVAKELKKNSVKDKDIIIPRSEVADLRKMENCRKVVKGTDILIHVAGNVGGIGKNLDLPGTLFYDNIMMGVQLIHAAMEEKLKKVVIIGTVCAYPKYAPVPFREEDLWIGYPEETNAPYALAKKVLLVQSQAYRTQFGLESIYLLPTNLYGPGSDFNSASSHVIPAIIKKIAEAKQKSKDYIKVWGDGSPTREFLYAGDAARGIVLAARKYNSPEPVNLGRGTEISIKELAEMICHFMDYKGSIHWDITKPNGQPRRRVDSSRAEKLFGFKAKVRFEEGLKKTIKWYLEHRSKLLST